MLPFSECSPALLHCYINATNVKDDDFMLQIGLKPVHRYKFRNSAAEEVSVYVRPVPVTASIEHTPISDQFLSPQFYRGSQGEQSPITY